MDAPWIALAAIVGVALVYVLLPAVVAEFIRFRPGKQLCCPETTAAAEVSVDARWAAVTAPFRRPVLKVRSCSLWPERARCGQNCLRHFEK